MVSDVPWTPSPKSAKLVLCRRNRHDLRSLRRQAGTKQLGERRTSSEESERTEGQEEAVAELSCKDCVCYGIPQTSIVPARDGRSARIWKQASAGLS